MSSMDFNNIIQNRTCNGKCSSCGECCSDILPLDNFEIKKIRDYINKHKIKESKHTSIFDTRIDMTCPFRDNEKKICTIYPVRPAICKCFICSKQQADAIRDRDLFYKKKSTHSMRNLFYGGKSVGNIFCELIQKLGETENEE